MITNSGLGEFRELLYIQLKPHDLVDLDQIPSPSLLFKLNRHKYSNLPSQSSHCTSSPPLQPYALHVSRTVHSSRYEGITIVYRKKRGNFPSPPWWHAVFCWHLQTPQRISREGFEADPGSTTAQSWTQGCNGLVLGFFFPPRFITLHLLTQGLSCLYTHLPHLAESFWQWDFPTISTIWLLERHNITKKIGDFTVHYLFQVTDKGTE